MWIPLELINYIFYLADTAKIVYYHKKRKEFVIKIDINHNTLVNVRDFYNDFKIYTKYIPNRNVYPFIRETQVCYPLKKCDSFENTSEYETTLNSMLTIVDECNSPKSEINVIHSWNRFFVMNSTGGKLLKML